MENTHGTTMTATMDAPRPIPTPPDFPVAWERPEDASVLWSQDVMHFPAQITPLDGDYLRRFMDIGFCRAAETAGLPIRSTMRRINTFYYDAMAPVTTDPVQLEILGTQAEAAIGAALGTMEQTWGGALLPEIEASIAAFAAFDLRSAPMPALVRHLDASLERTDRLMTIHFLIGMPMLLGMSLFQECYTDLFGGSALDAFTLLQGFDNKTLEANRALARVARSVRASKAATKIFTEVAAEKVIAALEADAGCDAALADLRAYLSAYGKRATTWFVLSETPFIDDPTPVIRLLQDAIAHPERDPEAEQAALAAARDAAIADARAKLAGFPEAVRGQFEFLLKAGQLGTVIQEDHGYWLDFRSTYEMHRVVREFGRRFAAAGLLDAAADVSFLTFAEIRAAGMMGAYQPLVAARKAEMATFATVAPPRFLGAFPPGAPPDDPMTRTMMKFFGGPQAPQTDASVLAGNAGSKGVVRGTARVVRTLAEAGKLGKGEILVTGTTSPPWTPLFATAAAVVTDTGGVLSHCAVVAREYMIPAVVGTGTATLAIADGQLIEVDGTAGVVRIIGAS